ncbi:conserved hypothetical protein [Ricinus communis]|uniref:Uncharacterized protein n=1 Tax=Ricinus communis TaxID=3988 RepID=B9TIV9_RICCO|nr:conserved hypothetical protein [Ricinus communis]
MRLTSSEGGRRPFHLGQLLPEQPGGTEPHRSMQAQERPEAQFDHHRLRSPCACGPGRDRCKRQRPLSSMRTPRARLSPARGDASADRVATHGPRSPSSTSELATMYAPSAVTASGCLISLSGPESFLRTGSMYLQQDTVFGIPPSANPTRFHAASILQQSTSHCRG